MVCSDFCALVVSVAHRHAYGDAHLGHGDQDVDEAPDAPRTRRLGRRRHKDFLCRVLEAFLHDLSSNLCVCAFALLNHVRSLDGKPSKPLQDGLDVVDELARRRRERLACVAVVSVAAASSRANPQTLVIEGTCVDNGAVLAHSLPHDIADGHRATVHERRLRRRQSEEDLAVDVRSAPFLRA